MQTETGTLPTSKPAHYLPMVILKFIRKTSLPTLPRTPETVNRSSKSHGTPRALTFWRLFSQRTSLNATFATVARTIRRSFSGFPAVWSECGSILNGRSFRGAARSMQLGHGFATDDWIRSSSYGSRFRTPWLNGVQTRSSLKLTVTQVLTFIAMKNGRRPFICKRPKWCNWYGVLRAQCVP